MTRGRSVRTVGDLSRAALILTLIWAALFGPQLFLGQTFTLGDSRLYYPFREYSRERWMERHERTFWNPFVYGGLSASASLADTRPQYLPDFALDLFERMRPGRIVPLAGPLLAHLAGMLAMAALARSLIGCSTAGMVWAGVAFGLSPMLLVPFAFGHDAFLVSTSLMPVVLVVARSLFFARSVRTLLATSLLLALVTGVQALDGHPQVVAYSTVVLAAFLLVWVVETRRPWRIALVVLALAWGAAMSAAAWWPAYLYGTHSARAGAGPSEDQVMAFSLGWYELTALVWPRAVGGSGATYWGGLWSTDYPRFLGVTVVALSLPGFFAWRRLQAKYAWLLLSLVVVSALVAVGPRLGPLYDLLHRWVPFFSLFRVSSMVLVVAALGTALLSSAALSPPSQVPPRGSHQATRARTRMPPIAWAAPAATIALIGLGLSLAGGALDELYTGLARSVRPRMPPPIAAAAAHSAGSDLILRTVLLAAALVLVRLRRGGFSMVPATALIAFLAIDLGSVSYPILSRGSGGIERLTARPMPELARRGAAEPAARVDSHREVDDSLWQLEQTPTFESVVNDWVTWRARTWGGEHGTPPGIWARWLDVRSLGAMKALGIVYVSALPSAGYDSTIVELVAETPGEAVYRLVGALSRAYAVPKVEVAESESAAFDRVEREDFDPAAFAVTADPEAGGSYPGSSGCRIRWVVDEPDSLIIETESDAPAFVVVADPYFPGWSATLDGRPATLRRVNHFVRGVAVPQGTHRIGMSFEPEGWATAVPFTRWALGLWIVAGMAWLLAGRFVRSAAVHPAAAGQRP